MKHFTLSLKWLVMSLLLGVSVGAAAEDVYSYTFASKVFEDAGTQTLGDVSWTLAVTFNATGSFYGYEGTRGQQLGSKSYGVNPATLTTSGITGTIKSVKVNASHASSGAGKLSVKVNGVAYTCESKTEISLSTSATDYTFEGSESGEIVITLTQGTTKKATYIKSITVVSEESVVDNRTAVNLTSFTSAAPTIVKGNTTSTTVANDQSGWTAAYTYSSSDEDVATVDANGVITGKSRGTADITVSLNLDAEDANYKAGTTTSLTVSIRVANDTHVARFSVNGVIDESLNSVTGEDDPITFPAAPADIFGKAFVGWLQGTTIDGTTDLTPALVTSATMGTSDVTFYAVFAKVTKGTLTTVTDNLTYSTVGVSGTKYTTWSNVSATSNAVYAGQSAGGNSSIQLRNSNPSCIVSTTSGGKVKKVVVEWNSNTTTNSSRSLEIYGNNSAYTSPEKLYSTDTKGTSLGTIVYTTSTELTVEGDYEYVGILPQGGAMYFDKISITWETGTPDTYSEYSTTVSAPAVTIGAAGYATYVAPCDVEFPTGVTGYIVSSTADGYAQLEEILTAPAGAAIIVKADAAGTYTLGVADELVDWEGENQLQASDGTVTGDGSIYVLADGDNGVGFYPLADGDVLPAGKAYLSVAAAAKAFIGFHFGDANAIEGVTTADELNAGRIYNLSGQRLGSLQKGLNIVNGKKVFIK